MVKSLKTLKESLDEKQIRRHLTGGLPFLGRPLGGIWKSDNVQAVADIYENYSVSESLLISGHSASSLGKIRLGGGSPAPFQPFPNAVGNLVNSLNERILSHYPMAAGDDKDKKLIIDYLADIGIKNDLPYKNSETVLNGLSLQNLIFTYSSTHAYSILCEEILDIGDVVLTTAPNYGLFVFNPERVGGKVELIDLCKEDSWLLTTRKYRQKIKEINNQLEKDFKTNPEKYLNRKEKSPPKVRIFLHMNPHNPTGKVYSLEHKKLLQKLSQISLEEGIFIIDDLVYRGLEYNPKKPALPIASLDGQFSNTISLFSLSKTYGLASFRAGMIVADEVVTSLVRDRIFQHYDSHSILQSAALAGTFTADPEIASLRGKYIQKNIKQYIKKYYLVKSMIDGIDSIPNKYKSKIKTVVEELKRKEDVAYILEGIPYINIVIEPESGFFLIINFSSILGKNYMGYKIEDDASFLKFLYTSNNIKLLTGNAFCWPDKDQLVGRVTTALEDIDLVDSFLRLKKAILELK